MLISLENASKVFADRMIFMGASLKVEESDRIGLVGINGAGKTTLMRVLSGELSCDSGERAMKSNLSVGYLKQNSGVDGAHTIYEEMRSVFSSLLDVQSEMKQAADQIALFEDHSDAAFLELQNRYARLETYFSANDGYNIDVKIEIVLCGMGFRFIRRETICGTLSGGEKTRLALAKLLLGNPDILMLDEPTNHLDFETLEWLEEYLQSFKGALVVVSHDRYFLDRICTKIWDVVSVRIQAYKGNYTKYLHTRDMLYDRQLKEYEMQQQDVAKLTDYIARNKARASTANMAKSKEKQLARMEVLKPPPTPPIVARITFHYEQEPVKDILHVEGVTLYAGGDSGGKLLCSAIDFDLMRGEKVALVGANGVGKSSFLKAILRKIEIESGKIHWGRNVRTAYYEQETLDLSPFKTVMSELWDRFPQTYEKDIRNVLGCLRFFGDDVQKRVDQLSGGEKARLKFAIMMYQSGNVLLLDEPTNHLDLPTKEALDQALCQYEGTILTISHDRYLLRHMPTRIVEMRSNGLISYQGGYEEYTSKKRFEASSALSQVVETTSKEKTVSTEYYRNKKQRSEDAARRKRFLEVEQEISDMELMISVKQEQLRDPELARDYVQLQEAYGALDQLRSGLNERMEEWTLLAEEYA